MAKSALDIGYNDLIEFAEQQERFWKGRDNHRHECAAALVRLLKKFKKDPQLDLFKASKLK